jgi:Domain of unknown function (DUF4351)
MQTGSASIVLRQLRGVFGQLDESLQERIRALPLKKIEKLGDALIKFESVKDLDAWLKQNAPASRRRTQQAAVRAE